MNAAVGEAVCADSFRVDARAIQREGVEVDESMVRCADDKSVGWEFTVDEVKP